MNTHKSHSVKAPVAKVKATRADAVANQAVINELREMLDLKEGESLTNAVRELVAHKRWQGKWMQPWPHN